MNKRTDATQASKIPTEEEIREEFEKLLKEKYGDNIKVVKHEVSRDDGKKEDSSKDTNKIKLDFELKPKDIKAYLDRYVIEQDEAKKALAISHRGYVLAMGYNKFEGPGELILNNEEIDKLYLGG